VDAGSLGARSALVSVAAPSEAGGLIASALPEAMESVPLGVVAPEAAVLAAPVRSLEEPEPSTRAGPEVEMLCEIVVVVGTGPDGAETRSALALMSGAELVTTDIDGTVLACDTTVWLAEETVSSDTEVLYATVDD
jgi:hypothetical protein